MRAPGIQVAILAIAITILTFSAAAETRPETLTRTFYDRFAAGDVEGAAALWVDEQAPEFIRRHARPLRLHCTRLQRLRLTSERTSPTTATVHAAVDLSDWKNDPSQPVFVTRNDKLLFRFASGRWHIEGLVRREHELAALLARASAEEQNDLLRSHPELLNLELTRVLVSQATTSVNEQRLAQAVSATAIASRVAGESGDPRALALVLSMESVLARQYDVDRPRSTELAERSVALAERSGDPDVWARCMLRLIRARFDTDRPTVPELVETVMAIADRVDDLSTIAMVATQAARYYDETRSPREALAYSLLAERYAEESGDVPARISAQMNLGGAHIRKGDCYLAEPHYQRALVLARAAGFFATTAEILGNLAYCERGRGAIGRAADMMNESVALLESSGVRSGKLGGIVHRIFDLAQDGNFAAAEADLKRAREVAEQDGDSVNFVKYATGVVRVTQQRFAEALEAWEGLDHRFAAKPSRYRAVALRRVGRHADAESELRKLIVNAEDLRAKISTDYRQLLTYNDRITIFYHELVDLLVECGRAADALDVYESHRASVLRDLLAGGGVHGVAFLTDSERARVAELEQRIGELIRETNADTKRERQLAAARLELAKVTAEAYADDAGAQWPAQPPPPPVASLSIEPGAAYLAYCVLTDRTIAFKISRAGDGSATVEARVIPIGRAALRERIAAFTQQMERRDFAIGRASEELYATLVRGAGIESFDGLRRLHIVPDDALWQLPFHALKPARRSYLLEHVTVSYAPSIVSIEPFARHDRARVVALGDPAADGRRGAPPLPRAALEAQRLRQFYGAGRTRIAVQDEATEAAVKQAGEYDVLHIAAHAVVDKLQPLYSALLLSGAGGREDGYLEAREIASLDLRDRLVVLAACETGRGQTIAAEGVVGLPWAVLAAGARATVLSLWKTDSASTADTMIEFHRHHARGASPDEALRQAQLAMLEQPRYRHPLYWAPFIVVKGAYRAEVPMTAIIVPTPGRSSPR